MVEQDSSVEARGGEVEVHEAEHSETEKLVPVAEAIRYRKRAQAAETQLSQAKDHLQEMQTELEQARATIDQLDRRQQIDTMLAEAEAVDMEVARLLTEAAVEMMDEADIALAVADLRSNKPYLFRRRAQEGAGAMSPRMRPGGTDSVEQVRQQAKSSGDRRDLLQYLRMKRK